MSVFGYTCEGCGDLVYLTASEWDRVRAKSGRFRCRSCRRTWRLPEVQHEGGDRVDARYIVVAVEGYSIDPSSLTSRHKGTSYSVLDTEWAYREVGEFYVGPNAPSVAQKQKAERLCRELNQRDRNHLRQDAA